MGTTSRRRKRALSAAAVALTAVGLIAPPTASADPGEHPSYAPGGRIAGLPPEEAYADVAGCPSRDASPEGTLPEFCLRATVYDGEIKLGGVTAAVEGPIEIVVGIAFGTDSEGNPAGVIVPAEGGGGGPGPVKIAGGLLGMPDLDPLIDALGGLLSVSATPAMGAVGVPAAEAVDFLDWLGGSNSEHVTLNLPLSINVDNLLLGNKCRIDEFQINLTTGTTTPPEGVDPMSGSHGDFLETRYHPGATGTPSTFSPNFAIRSRVGATLVDNAFAVPGAGQCDLLVGDLLDQPVGLFDSVINGQVGLPSGAGNNHAVFKIDTVLVPYPGFLIAAEGTPATPNAFGDVAVGTTSPPLTVTVTGTGGQPFRPGPAEFSGFGAADYQVLDDGCVGQELLRGDACTVDIAFAPASTGNKSANFEVRDAQIIEATVFPPGKTRLQVSGRGV